MHYDVHAASCCLRDASVIVMAGRHERLEQLFTSVTKVARVYHPYSMPYEHFDVFYCRGLKAPLPKCGRT